MAQQAPTYATRQPHQEQVSVWMTLLLFFFAFCVMVAVAGYAGWQYYTTTMAPVSNTLVLKYVDTGVLVRQPGRTVAQDLTDPAERPSICPEGASAPRVCDYFREGQRLEGSRGAGYGPVAALKLPDQTLINLHTQPDGFDFMLKRYRISRWTKQRQEVVFEQSAGYARYDLATNQLYHQVDFSVLVGGATVRMERGGSYSIDVPRTANGMPRGRLVTDKPFLFEMAVRSGSASVSTNGETINLRPGDKVQVALDGSFVLVGDSPYQAATWQLIPDGDFAAFTTAQYNTPGATTTWNISDYDPTNGRRVAGRFSTIETCPPEKLICPDAQIHYGQFLRDVGDNQPYNTGVVNPLDVDISEYTALSLSLDATVVSQSLDATGDLGTECPIFVILSYKQRSPTDSEQQYNMCLYTSRKPENEVVKDNSIQYYQQLIPVANNSVVLDLRAVDAPIRDAWYISSISVQARGHDYFSRVTRVSLIGE